MGLSVGLDTAVKALRAHQLSVDTAAHNIANAHTPGFSRQRVLLRPEGINGSALHQRDDLLGRPGMGVNASDVNRVRDTFMDQQVRASIGEHARYELQGQALGRAEMVFNDPTDEGMSSTLASFWNAWHDVVNEPESSPARTSLVHATETMTSRIRQSYAELESQRENLNSQLSGIRDEINAAANEVANLNLQIKKVELGGASANDLRDQRDLQLDRLSEIANITYNEREDGTVTAYMGNHELVFDTTAREVGLAEDPADSTMDQLVFEMDGMPVETTTGKLKGLYDARDNDLPGLMQKLDDFAIGLIDEVNTAHSAGYGLDDSTGLDFFTGTGAGDIGLNQDLADDPQKIASSDAAGTAGNNAVALQIADLQLADTMGGETFDDYYANMVSVLGADVSRAEGLAQSGKQMNDHLESMRQSVSGVNIDEEVSNMAASQRAYEASARVITTIDQMLETLINGTGVVGR
ncbi:MAG: flagellar hook-associated protein FlgK [Dehalococcoidia bacterium]|nr:flagellar hook-associated protein FlgK [Dehalococcoidia bacterium]